jgi:hypothetical protein
LVVLTLHLRLSLFEMKRLILRTTVRVRSSGGAVGDPYVPFTAPGAILTMFGAASTRTPAAAIALPS